VKSVLIVILGLGIHWTGWSLSAEGLQALIDKAPVGQTVLIPSGIYQGELVVRRPLVLHAQPGTKLVHSPGTTGPTLWIQSSDVTVNGLEIESTGEGTRRDHTAILVTGSRVSLESLKIRRAWSGIWLDHCQNVSVSEVEVTGLSDSPFWERGEGVRVTDGTNIQLQRLQLVSLGDGIYAEHSANLAVSKVAVRDARYGLHLMFSDGGEVSEIQTSQTVVGVMVMESRRWIVRDSHLLDGYRTGSAGVREIRTKDVSVLRTQIARQASGIEVLDARNGLFQDNWITENGIAWTWGADNSGTRVQDNNHRGNVIDFAGEEANEKVLMAAEDHDHMNMGANGSKSAAEKPASDVSATQLSIRPKFDRNYWDAWRGTDLDQDGIGDTPYRFDRDSSARTATRPWAGIFLGSPWSQWSETVPGGEVIDQHPRTRAGG